MFVATHPHNNSLVVLIHGVMSNRYMAWEAVIDLIQRIHHRGQGILRSYDFHAFGYTSGSVHQPPLKDCFDGLRKLIDQPRYDTVILIGHSQGGIAAKLFLIDELEHGRGEHLKVDIVITLDSPHRGPQPWIYPLVLIGGAWKRLPYLRRLPLFRQVAELGFASGQLKKLRSGWSETLVALDPCPPEPKRRHIRSYTVSGQTFRFPPLKLVVSKRSAEGFDIDEPLPAAGIKGAWGLGHGISAMDAYRQQIEQILSEHDAAHLMEVSKNAETVPVATFETLLAMHCAAGELECEAQSWKRRFVRSFGVQPLRKLGLEKAIEKFVALRIGHP